MTRKFLLVLILTAANSAFAKGLTVQDMKERIQLNADIYVTDETGQHIIAGPERTNFWKPNNEKGIISGDWGSNLKGNWYSNEDVGGQVALRYRFEVADDSSIKGFIEEYSKDDDRGQFSGLIDRKEFVIKNFEPIVWPVKNVKSAHFVARFILSLREISKPVSVENLPIAATGISISDSAGYLWAEDVTFNGKYSGLTSHRGSLALSYLPFTGATEMGVAEGNKITLTVNKNFKINLKAATSFLPAGVTAKVYALYLPDRKKKSFNSLHTFDTGRESRVQEALKE